MTTLARTLATWLPRQIEEVRADRVLTYYGAALAAANFVTFLQWYRRYDLAQVLSNTQTGYCWPFWESCLDYRLSAAGVTACVLALLFLSLLSLITFLLKEVPAG